MPELSATANCSEYNLIDLHGSGAAAYTQSPPGSVLATQLQMLLAPKQVEVDTVPFEAAGGPIKLAGAALKLPHGYHQSVVKMKDWLRERLKELATDCPKAKIILSGYSQGAQAVGDVYQEQSWAEVVGVVLFGDPYYNHTDSSDRFGLNVKAKKRIKTKLDGALAAPRPRKAFTSQKVLSFCHQEDSVCQALSKYELVEYKTSQHTNYTTYGEPGTAAKYFANLIGDGSSPKPQPAKKWPTNRHDGTTNFFIMLGADFISPEWSSCDDDYCIVGSSGEVYVYAHMYGYDRVGTIPISASDPHKELKSLGVPEQDITQLLAQ
jgi:predicted esterase